MLREVKGGFQESMRREANSRRRYKGTITPNYLGSYPVIATTVHVTPII
jgi:hypothetical protein